MEDSPERALFIRVRRVGGAGPPSSGVLWDSEALEALSAPSGGVVVVARVLRWYALRMRRVWLGCCP